ncbi:MAG TPA: hypothetical protein VGE89_07480 [Bryobacteraceae bacterium]|jgi:uncharacterized protein (TIGR02646 family)
MRVIVKGKEPASLVEFRSAPGGNYDGYKDKDTLRRCLVKEQRGLCCYCLSRIRPEPGSMKIEHWHSQDRYEAEQLDYGNLLGACMGNEGKAHWDQHCDTRKGDRDLSRNPANPMHRVDDLVRFAGDGTVFSSDPAFDAELNDVLKLNLKFLMNNRKSALDAFKTALDKRGQLSQTTLKKWLREWNGESDVGELREFCQVVVYWLRKRLARS